MIGLALLALIASLAANASPAGLYRTHQMEVAGALELQANGHFRYALSYGAVDEEGEGKWSAEPGGVRLTSNPMPRRATFELVRDEPAASGELSMTVEDPGFEWGHPLRALAQSESGRVFEIEADDSGKVHLEGKPPIKAIAPEMPVFGSTGQVFSLRSNGGHRLFFRFHANDLGKARFDHERLQQKSGDLLLERFDTIFRFVKVRP